MTTFAGRLLSGITDGVGTIALFKHPAGITQDNNEILYVSDYTGNNIRTIFSSGVCVFMIYFRVLFFFTCTVFGLICLF